MLLQVTVLIMVTSQIIICNTQEDSTTLSSNTEDEYPNEPNNPEVIIDSNSGVQIPHPPNPFNKNKFSNKHIPLELLQKLNPANILKPIGDKISKITEFFTYPSHPNYGGVQLLSPQDLWEKLHEKGHHFLTGANGAIFGLGHHKEDLDYPFAYRQGKAESGPRNFLQELMGKYKENRSEPFKFNFDYVKVNESGNGELYKFPYMLGEAQIKAFLRNVSGLIGN